MGCAASKAVPPPPAETGATETVPRPVAFEIPIAEAESSAKAKKPPPQILQRLEEQNQNANLTAEELKEKQQKAEERRQTILEEKCRVARQAQKMFNKSESPHSGEEKENVAS